MPGVFLIARPDATPIVSEQAERRTTPASNVERSSLGRDDAYLVVQSDQIFSRDGAEALRDIVDALNKQPTIANVQWLDQAPPLNIFGLSEPILPRGQASPQRFAIAKAKAQKHPLIVGMFLSQDARTLLIHLRFNWVFVTEDEDCTENIVKLAKETLAHHPSVSMQFSITGSVPINIAVKENHESNELTFQLIGYGMILLMAILLFRGMTVVGVVATAPAMGVFWSLGFLRYFGWEDNPFRFGDFASPVEFGWVCRRRPSDGLYSAMFERRAQPQNRLPECSVDGGRRLQHHHHHHLDRHGFLGLLAQRVRA